jgi:hypothetical protein
MGSFTAGVSDIALGTSNVQEVWYGDTLIWQRSGAPAETWLAKASGDFILIEYTPVSTQVLASMSLVFSDSTSIYNYCWGVWTKVSNIARPVSGFVGTNSTAGVSFTNEGTLGAYTKWRHTKAWASGSRTTLTAGTTYLLGMGERYSAYSVLSGATTASKTFDWSISATGDTAAVSAFSPGTVSFNMVFE